jgi:hypothetical protein
MARTITVVFDGEVFRPREPVDLPAHAEYRLTVEESKAGAEDEEMPEVFRRILGRARDLGVGDLAEQHDHYLCGTPKR